MSIFEVSFRLIVTNSKGLQLWFCSWLVLKINKPVYGLPASAGYGAIDQVALGGNGVYLGLWLLVVGDACDAHAFGAGQVAMAQVVVVFIGGREDVICLGSLLDY